MKNGMFIHINWRFWTINSILSMILSSIICFTIWFHDMMIWDILGIVFHDRFQIFLCVPVKMGRFGIGPSWESSTFSGYPLPQLPHGHKDHCQPWIKQSQWNINHWSSDQCHVWQPYTYTYLLPTHPPKKLKKKKRFGPVILGAATYIAAKSWGKMLPSCIGLRDHQIGFSHYGKGGRIYLKECMIYSLKYMYKTKVWNLELTTVKKLLYLLRFCC